MVKQTIQIFARIKPTQKDTSVYYVNSKEQASASLEFLVPKDTAEGFVNNKKECFKFRFQKVFDQATKQENIFEDIAKPVTDSVLAGYNGTIFAYGQTGTGKTFTITGGAERFIDRGIIPRTLTYLYERFSQDNNTVYTTHISYLEIYNEMGYDLLDPRQEAARLEDLPKVIILEDPDHNIHIKNLSMLQSANEEEALNHLFLGDTNRMIAENPMNQASTRSHCIFTVHLCMREPGSDTLRHSKLHLVDLAGSDRASKTGLNGLLLTEAKFINLSLHYLEQVIIALSERNRSHIPYRNSMLTSVLRDSLGGNCMTTMIATVSVDRSNIDESISTCRFAQRVALIKNEAVLNEELDPALLIARLKQEVQSLKEELSMLTGEERNDKLAVEEIQKLEELVTAFLHDAGPDVSLSLGPDMRKIQYCFSLLKKMILGKLTGNVSNCDIQESPAVKPEENDICELHSANEIAKLKEMLMQRDKEISILVKILKKEKQKAEDAATQLTGSTHRRKPATASDSSSLAMLLFKEGNHQPTLNGSGGRAILFSKKGPQLSMGKQEAFETFITDHDDHPIIENNRSLLKERSAQARKLGDQLQDTKQKINELKKQIEIRRRQRAVHGVTENHQNVERELDPLEENLRKNIEQEKKIYKSTVGHLKTLKTEIEHLQLLLEKAKVKLQKDFRMWWNEETSNVQETKARSPTRSLCGTLQPSSPGTPGFEYTPAIPGLQTTVRPGPADKDCSSSSGQDFRNPKAAWPDKTQEDVSEFAPSSEWRSLSKSSPSLSSIPLTGDHQADADILAFIRARQNLLNRAGAPQQ
ncbi:kinesin-like protein KIF6 isoform X1 [Nerophis lumbriciformis]|uniref:kinesin-like protein KIF6 isoform X1 n=1 Tax=Nerophis lumbriciformis TaxID=546530 RepID=UPI002ADF3F2D|nr:kinesin-like protein KIF6 isoform X1 [Nerophis lumbriciformis]